jgi:thiamine-monophosphate kinase
VAALGEFGLIQALSAWLAPDPETPGAPRALVGIGDDAAVLAAPDGRVVATTDFLLEGRHFRRDWSSAADIGRKAAARSLADIAAMGAVPSGLLVALAAPGDLPVSWARDLAAGLAAECARAGAAVIGGDTARASSVLLAVTGLGDLAGRDPVRRSGAVPGDLVAVAGPLGHAAAGLALLSAGLARGGDPPEPPAPGGTHPPGPPLRPLVTAHQRPAPPYDAGPEAAGLGATAMIDVSDGLLADLGHIAAASGVLIDVTSARLRPGGPLLAAARAVPASLPPSLARTDRGARITPPDPPLAAEPSAQAPSARAPSARALRWVLTGGEDHSLAATFPPGVTLPPRWTVIGAVRRGQGVVVDGRPWTGSPGWDHFAAEDGPA